MAHISYQNTVMDTEDHPLTTGYQFNSPTGELAHHLWQAAVQDCHGKNATYEALRSLPSGRSYAILSIGKAAVSMTLGAHEALGIDIPSLTLTKTDHIDETLQALIEAHPHIKGFESAHPMPDETSLKAGQMAKDFVEACGSDTCLIMLVSGGGSALCELLPEDISLDNLQEITKEKLSTGATIEEINSVRSEISLIKQGKLFTNYRGKEVKAYLISDVAGEDVTTIASGLAIYPKQLPSGQFEHEINMLKTNRDGRQSAEHLAKSLGLDVILNEENLYGDVYERAVALGDILKNGSEGVYIFGGEPTVNLPENPGEGGRAQCLALALSRELDGINNITCLIAGSDGTDGPTIAAGGLINGSTFTPENAAERALIEANAGAFLRTKDALYITGSTGTNVMDFAICIKLPQEDAKRALACLNKGS